MGIRQLQQKAKVPANKVLTVVRTNATRWSNQQRQVARNIVLRPALDPVVEAFRRGHAADTVLDG